MPLDTDARQAGAPHSRSAAGLIRPLRRAAALAGLLLLAACTGSRGGPIPYDVANFPEPDRPIALTLAEGYQISPLDTLKVTVFQVDDLSGEYEVDLTGHIAMPLIGNVKAVDLTTAQLDEKLTQLLSVKYLQNPDVSIGVSKSSTRVVTVDGAVNQPGVFPINRQMTLLQVIAMARGANENANPRRVAVFRQVKGQRMAAAFDLTSIRRGQAEDPTVYSGDIVVVDGSNIRAIQREILSALPILSVFRPY